MSDHDHKHDHGHDHGHDHVHDSGEEGGSSGGPTGLAPRRASSVSFRAAGVSAGGIGADGRAAGTMMDPANQSLADALRVLLYVIYAGVAALALVYLLSGLRSIKEGERGLRVLFGKVSSGDLSPGLQWGPPYPLGEIKAVSQGVETVEINSEFWVYFAEGSTKRTLDNATPEANLDPSRGKLAGSIITGDGNIVHTQWSGQYRRSDVRSYATSVLPDSEQALVRTAIKQGVVRACAEVPIETVLMERQEEGVAPLSARARAIAQEVLDRNGLGITLEALSLTAKTAPVSLKRDFDKVANADTTRGEARDKALTDRSKVLSEVAGMGAEEILTMIDEYELRLARGDAKAAEAQLATIFTTLRGEGKRADGTPIRVAGSVTKLIGDATAYRTQAVSMRQGQLAAFRAKEAQFKASPFVMVSDEWTRAMGTLLARTNVATMLLPPGREGDTLQLMINQDPRGQRELEKALNEQDASKAAAEQLQRQRERGFETSVEKPVDN